MGCRVRRGIAVLKQHECLILLTVAVILPAVAAIPWSMDAWPLDAWPLAAMTVGQRTLLVIGIEVSILALWKLPPWQAARAGLDPMERFTAENEARKTLAQILGGVVVLLSLVVAWGTLEVSREGQITDRFTKAIAQLGEQREE